MLIRNGIGVCITYTPYRKKPCLCIEEGNTLTKVASFNNEESAKWFADKMEQFFDGMIKEGGRDE